MSANPVRGEASVTVGGAAVTLRPTAETPSGSDTGRAATSVHSPPYGRMLAFRTSSECVMPCPAHTSTGSAVEDEFARERSAIAEARESLRSGHVLSGIDAESWLDAWERGEEPAIPEFRIPSDVS